MSNPFKKGDKVVENMEPGKDLHKIGVATVTGVDGQWVFVDTPSSNEYHRGTYCWHFENLRAAIAGQDYHKDAHQLMAERLGHVCTPRGEPPAAPSNGPLEYEPNTGHLPDGSSVQKHSAGPLYPCVIAMRDGQLGGKYDYGVISPRNQEPLWLSNHAAAVTLAETIKKDLT